MGDLFDATAAELMRVATHLAPDLAAAEDLVQACFVTAIQAADRHDPGRPVLPWLLGILGNHAKRQQQTRVRRPDPARLRPPLTPSQAPEAAAAHQELERAVSDAIEQLPERYRAVLRLHLRHGLGPTDIAIDLGRAPATVRKQLQRGLQRLRAALPTGAALALPALLLSSPGLAAVRRAVLQGARLHHATPVLHLATPGFLMKKTLIAATAVSLACLVPLLWWRAPAPPASAETDRTASRSMETAARPTAESLPQPAAARTPSAVASSAAERGALEILVTWSDTGSPAAGIEVRALPTAHDTPALLQRQARTDPDGRARLAGLPAGTWTVETDRGARTEAATTAGRSTPVHLHLPPALTVKGTAVDDDGRGVGGAEITLSDADDFADTAVVAKAAPDGTFLLRGVPRRSLISARAPGHRSAMALRASSDVDGTVELRLVLHRGGRVVRGRVVRPDGTPVAGAAVVVGFIVDADLIVPFVSPRTPARPPVITRTDAHGRFAAIGVRTDVTEVVWVRADGFAMWRGPAPLSAEEIVVELQPGGDVAGVLRGPDGAPCAGVDVTMLAHEAEGAHGLPRWARHAQQTDAEGRFRLRAVPAGTRRIHARGSGWQAATATLQITAGATVRWEPRLDPALSLRGRVRDTGGAPLIGCVIRATAPGDGASVSTESDSEGRFAFPDCDDRRFELAVFEPGAPPTFAIARAEASPGAEVEIRVPDSSRATASLTGRLFTAGTPVPSAAVCVLPEPFASTHETRAAGGTGRFEIANLPPGLYRVIVRLPEEPVQWLGEHRLAPGQRLDLGPVELHRPGRIGLRVTEYGGTAPKECSYRLRPADGGQGFSGRLELGEGTSPPLPPGEWELEVWGPTVPLTRRVVSVQARSTTHSAVEAAAGARCTFEVAFVAGGEPLFGEVVWTRADGSELRRDHVYRKSASPLRLVRAFAAGTYSVTVDAGEHGRAHADFAVGADLTARTIAIALAPARQTR